MNMASSTIKYDGMKTTILLNNNTPTLYNADDTLVASGIGNYKYLIVNYLYGAAGWEYTRLIDIDNSRPPILDTIVENVYSSLNINKGQGWVKILTNGSVSGVYIRRIVGVN